MTRYRITVVLMAAALTIGHGGSRPCFAAEKAKPKHARSAVALVDVAKLYQDSKWFKAEMEKMKADVVKAEEKVRKEQEKIKSQRAETEKLPAGSEERVKQEDYQTKLEAALSASVSIQKTTFLRREAAVYLEFYKRVQAEVAAYAKENGIDVVIRANIDPLDASKPESVLSGINRSVIWSAPDADITAVIHERLEKREDSPQEGDK